MMILVMFMSLSLIILMMKIMMMKKIMILLMNVMMIFKNQIAIILKLKNVVVVLLKENNLPRQIKKLKRLQIPVFNIYIFIYNSLASSSFYNIKKN